jgi:hypothetical protein
MGCACGGAKSSGPKPTWTVTHRDGTKKSYNTEVEARMAVSRKGGTYVKNR